MQKEVFQTDGHGLFLYKTAAHELPLSPGNFNIPYGAYEDAPPKPVAGKWPRREGNSWVMVEDHRTTPLWVVDSGAAYSVGAEVESTAGKLCYPGWGPLPKWLTTVEPSPPAEDPVTEE